MMHTRSSFIVLLLGCAVAMPTAAKAQWVAYNDFAWKLEDGLFTFGRQGGVEQDPDYRIIPDDPTSGLERVTLFTSANSENTDKTGQFVEYPYAPDLAVEPPESTGEQARSGFLRNYDTGATLPVRADVNATGQTWQFATRQGAPSAEAPGRDVYNEFWDQDTGEPAVGLWGDADGNDVDGVHAVTLSNLNPNKFYEYTTYGNFGHYAGGNGNLGGVNWRWTKIEGYDPSGFENLSSVDTDYATAVNVFVPGDPSDPRNSVGHEQRAVIRSNTDPSHYVQNSGEIWFDGWVTKYRFKPGMDGEVQIVTKGINNAASMEFVDVGLFGGGGRAERSADTAGVPYWQHLDLGENGSNDLHITERSVENLDNGFLSPEDPGFGEHYVTGWRESSDPNQWPADPDVLEATVGEANSHFYLNAFKLAELALVVENADFNSDGDVDGDDFLTWQQGFGTGTMLAEGDANDDGAVNDVDLGIWQQQLGAVASQSAASNVPEPSTLLLVLSSALLCCGKRRRKA